MICYRLARIQYTRSLLASGAANRWNKSTQKVIYTSESISLCALELLAHTSGICPAGQFGLMTIEIEEPAIVHSIDKSDLSPDWNSLSAYGETQRLGSDWYEYRAHLMLRVPSAIIAQESNLVINTIHPDFEVRVRIKTVDDFFWDSRFPSS